MNLKEEKSVAAIVYHKDKYLLLKYSLGHWEFVKGHIEPGETEEDTIMRELREEAGISDAEFVNGFKENYDYKFNFKGQTIHKKVSCYLIKSNTKDVKLSFEHDDFIWLPIDKAIRTATYKNAKELLRKAKDFRSSTLKTFL
ncbi:MAG: bis(5'-nucleosyl)-tetraphosphatase [Candidatus Odinarchaeota archaeon]